jgi:hypothetical protein
MKEGNSAIAGKLQICFSLLPNKFIIFNLVFLPKLTHNPDDLQNEDDEVEDCCLKTFLSPCTNKRRQKSDENLETSGGKSKS